MSLAARNAGSPQPGLEEERGGLDSHEAHAADQLGERLDRRRAVGPDHLARGCLGCPVAHVDRHLVLVGARRDEHLLVGELGPGVVVLDHRARRLVADGPARSTVEERAHGCCELDLFARPELADHTDAALLVGRWRELGDRHRVVGVAVQEREHRELDRLVVGAVLHHPDDLPLLATDHPLPRRPARAGSDAALVDLGVEEELHVGTDLEASGVGAGHVDGWVVADRARHDDTEVDRAGVQRAARELVRDRLAGRDRVVELDVARVTGHLTGRIGGFGVDEVRESLVADRRDGVGDELGPLDAQRHVLDGNVERVRDLDRHVDVLGFGAVFVGTFDEVDRVGIRGHGDVERADSPVALVLDRSDQPTRGIRACRRRADREASGLRGRELIVEVDLLPGSEREALGSRKFAGIGTRDERQRLVRCHVDRVTDERDVAEIADAVGGAETDAHRNRVPGREQRDADTREGEPQAELGSWGDGRRTRRGVALEVAVCDGEGRLVDPGRRVGVVDQERPGRGAVTEVPLVHESVSDPIDGVGAVELKRPRLGRDWRHGAHGGRSGLGHLAEGRDGDDRLRHEQRDRLVRVAVVDRHAVQRVPVVPGPHVEVLVAREENAVAAHLPIGAVRRPGPELEQVGGCAVEAPEPVDLRPVDRPDTLSVERVLAYRESAEVELEVDDRAHGFFGIRGRDATGQPWRVELGDRGGRRERDALGLRVAVWGVRDERVVHVGRARCRRVGDLAGRRREILALGCGGLGRGRGVDGDERRDREQTGEHERYTASADMTALRFARYSHPSRRAIGFERTHPVPPHR